MIYTFDRDKLLQVVAATEAGTQHYVPYTGEYWGCPEETTPGLLVVFDECAFLVGNYKRHPNDEGLIAIPNSLIACRIRFSELERINAYGLGAGNLITFLSLDTVKSTLLNGTIPFIHFAPEKIHFGSVNSFNDLFIFPHEDADRRVEIAEIDGLIEEDIEELEDGTQIVAYRQYRGYARVPINFATRELEEVHDRYNYREYFRDIDFYMNPGYLWARCDLQSGNTLPANQIDCSGATLDGVSLAEVAVTEMLEYNDSEKERFKLEKLKFKCRFNPSRLPDYLHWEDFKRTVSDAFQEISPRSKVSFQKADHYGFTRSQCLNDPFIEFLLYRWIADNRPELAPHQWLAICSAGPTNCFPDLIACFYNWPRCEAHECI